MPPRADAYRSHPLGACAAISILVLLVGPAPARADPPPGCTDAVPAWISRASRQARVAVTADGCFDDIVRLRVSAPSGASIGVELSQRPRAAFRAAGRYGLSPTVDADYASLPADWRAAFDRLAVWVAAHDDEPLLPGAPAMTLSSSPASGSVPLVLLGALGVAAAAVVAGRRPRVGRDAAAQARGAVATYVGVTSIALAARVALGPWETFHGNGQGPLWVARLYGGAAFHAGNGPGYVELFGWPARWAGTNVEQALFAGNVALSTLTVVVALGLARTLGLAPRVAALVALVLALDPLAIRMSASESYLVPIAFGVAVATLLVARAFEAFERRTRLTGALWLLAAGLAVSQTARIHPCGWPALALVPLVAFARAPRAMAAPDTSWRGLGRAALDATLGAAVIALVVLATSAEVLWAVWQGARTTRTIIDTEVGLPPAMPLWPPLLVIALLALRRPSRASLAWAVPSAAVAASASAVYDALPVFRLAYLTLFVLAVLVALAWALPRRALDRRAALAGAAALPVVLLAATWALVSPSSTEARENQLVRGFVAHLPRDCRVAYVGLAPPRRVLALPFYSGRSVGERLPGVKLEGRDALELHTHGRGCFYYYRGSLCASLDGRGACRDAEGDTPLRRVARWSIPARPSMRDLRYDSDPVVVELFEVVKR